MIEIPIKSLTKLLKKLDFSRCSQTGNETLIVCINTKSNNRQYLRLIDLYSFKIIDSIYIGNKYNYYLHPESYFPKYWIPIIKDFNKLLFTIDKVFIVSRNKPYSLIKLNESYRREYPSFLPRYLDIN